MLWITVVNSTCFILIITKHTLLWYEFNICYWCHTLQKRKIVQIHCQTHNASQRKNRTQWMLPRWNRSPRQPVPQQHLQHRRYRHDRSPNRTTRTIIHRPGDGPAHSGAPGQTVTIRILICVSHRVTIFTVKQSFTILLYLMQGVPREKFNFES